MEDVIWEFAISGVPYGGPYCKGILRFTLGVPYDRKPPQMPKTTLAAAILIVCDEPCEH